MTPKILPWLARKAGITEERAAQLWKEAVHAVTERGPLVGCRAVGTSGVILHTRTVASKYVMSKRREPMRLHHGETCVAESVAPLQVPVSCQTCTHVAVSALDEPCNKCRAQARWEEKKP